MTEKIVNMDTEYVYVEMVFIQKNGFNRHEIISGLFQGIKVYKGSTFILLHGIKDAINIINLAFHNIMTIEVRHKSHKDMTHLTTKKSDQAFALTMLITLNKDLLENEFGQSNDKDLINITKYINVPREYHNNPTINLNSPVTYGVGDFAKSVASGYSNT